MPWFVPLVVLLLGGVFAGAQNPLESKTKVVALIFITSECPISNRMAPEIERLYEKFPTNEVAIWLVYPNKSDTAASIQKHRESYRLSAPFVPDPQHELVKKATVTVTPEAAVFDQKRALVYRGRINDRYLAIGRARPQALSHDLEEAIEAALKDRPQKQPFTKAVGCYIEQP